MYFYVGPLRNGKGVHFWNVSVPDMI